MQSFFDLQKFAHTGIASADMTAYDKAHALSLFGGGKTQTLTDVPPLSFPSNGSPITIWSMLGNTQQTGTPSPQSIIMPTFCGVRTGNLYFKKVTGANISDSGEINTLTGFDLYVAKVEQGVRYSGSGYIYAFFEDEPIIGSISFNGSRVVDSLNNVVSPISGFVAARVSNTAQNIMCNTGSSVLPYEPYGWAEKITCAGQTVPVYLGEVPTVRRIYKLVLTGNEAWTCIETARGWSARCSIPYNCEIRNYINRTPICSHYIGEYTDVTGHCYLPTTSTIQIADNANATDETTWTTFLASEYAAGHPVTVWYVLTEPKTGIVNEPLAKIGTYADELSSEYASVTIPTTRGQNTLTVDTDLQPSEMTITYKK